MNFKRKLYRSKHKEPHCCGRKMSIKGDITKTYYVCERCGKEKPLYKETDND